MKKILLLSLALLFSVSLSAQKATSSWWSIRGGVNFSNLSSEYYSTEYLTGFSVGVSYAHPISNLIPIYIESSILFEKSGARDNGFLSESGAESRLISYELEFPVMLGCKVPLSKQWAIHAAVGLYYSVALDGEFSADGDSFDPYRLAMLQTLRDVQAREQRLLHRSDFGVRIGVDALYREYLFGFSFDGGLLNLYSRELRDVGYQALASTFALHLGYVF